MPKLFEVSEIRKLVGQASKECALELLKEGKYGKRMTRADFKAHKECIRRKIEQKVREKIAGLR